MNPSADGWIKKLLRDISGSTDFINLTKTEFYHELKLTGYIYGRNVDIVHRSFRKKDMTSEELCKVNHILALYYMHHYNRCEKDFVDNVIKFYTTIDDYKESFLSGLLGKRKSSALLEKVINRRIHIDDNVLTKNFNYFITNALLFIDVLAYQNYILQGSISESYLKNFETAIETLTLTLFELKTNKSKYDESLIRLFDSSLRYVHEEHFTYKDIVQGAQRPLEKLYCVDIACMASWSDKVVEPKELVFLYKMGEDFKLDKTIIDNSILNIHTFYTTHKEHIALMTSNNPMKSFYENSSKMVKKLITRNSKRLLRELGESKELMILLTKSTTRNLTDAEQRKVQEQLLDIIKSIPSLAIFMLPGGAILLPLFVKFIPKLLPSAFDENRVEDE